MVTQEMLVCRPANEDGPKSIINVPLHLVSMRRNDAESGTYFSDDEILDEVRRMNEACAQAGIHFVDSAGGTLDSADIAHKDQPAGLDLDSGFDGFDVGIPITVETNDETALLNAPGILDGNAGTIDVIFINKFLPDAAGRQFSGQAFPDLYSCDNIAHARTAIVAKIPLPVSNPYNDPCPFVASHEIGHILTNYTHYTGLLDNNNVMRGSVGRRDSVTGAKRLWGGGSSTQINISRNNAYNIIHGLPLN